MTKDQKELFKNWEESTDEITQEFVRKYFGRDAEYFWIAEDVGGVLMVGDYYFNLDRIVEAIKYDATRSQLFDFYDMELEKAYSSQERLNINFRTYIKLSKSK